MSAKHKRVAIVYPFANIDSVPSMVNTVDLLVKAGYWVDVFTGFSDLYVKPNFTSEMVTVLPLDGISPSEWGVFWKIIPGRISSRYHWPISIRMRHQQIPYVCVIGVDPEGLVRAKKIADWVGVPLVYYSLELLLSYEIITPEVRLLKEEEVVLSREAAFLIIQDNERAELIIKDNSLIQDRVVTVPNAPLGYAELKRSNYLREKYKLSSETKIILHTGSLGAWTGIHQLLFSTHDWPDNWVLVVHTRYTPPNIDYLTTLKYIANPDRVIFSTEPLARELYPEVVCSADIGVVFYVPQPGSTYTQDNVKFIGKSSGKFAYYTKYGIPILINSDSTLTSDVRKYCLGSIAENPEITRQAIEKILDEYPAYCQNTLVYFQTHLDFSQSFDKVLDRISSL